MKTSLCKNSETFVKVLQHYKLFQDDLVYKTMCPFHGDKNPSMQINIQSAFFYCYGCGVHGSSAELVKLYNPDMSDLQVQLELKRIAGKGGYRGLGNTNLTVTKLTYREGINLAKDFYYNLPATNWYKADEDSREIKRYMANRGFTSRTLNKVQAKATYNANYPIVFPLLENEIFRGYVMRTDKKDVEENRKYMYNRGFKRKLTLIGTFEKEKPILLVEGYLDMLAAKQTGIKNVAAILGWKISKEQIRKLKRYGIKTIICGLDNDKSGIKGYKYLQQIAKREGFTIKRVRYPKNVKDFGDLLLNPEAQKKIKKAIYNIK